MLIKPRLFTPGPTPLAPEVEAELGRGIPHHRSPEFKAQLLECRQGLQAFLRTRSDVLILACSGSGAMEAAVVNALSPGERMLSLVAGRFGERWEEIGRAHGMDGVTLESAWGEAVAPERVAEALRADPSIRAVCVQYSESSTGVRHDIEAMGRIVRSFPDTVLVVDAISGAGAMPLAVDEWGLDVVVVGSQKALSLPPGLAFVSMSEKAWRRAESSVAPRFYFDLRKERDGQREGSTAFTPPISHVVALQAALAALAGRGGVDALVANASCLAAMTRQAAGALGLALVAPRDYGDALTALHPPAGLVATDIARGLLSEFGIRIAGGQGRLQGKILRIAHLGYYDSIDTFGLLAALEIVLRRLGHRLEPGAGLRAAHEAYFSTSASLGRSSS
jgi:aspartate aminotransferase-like enzyme